MMKIAELVKITGVPRTTIHYYIREGLLPTPQSAGKTVAYYNQEHVERLLKIKKMREVDLLPISEIKNLLAPINVHPKKIKAASGRAAATRKRILDAAAKEFSTKGYRKARVTQIIASLGISTMTFYRYFQNKRELFLEVVDIVFSEIVKKVEEEISGETDYLVRMLRRGWAFYETYSQYRDILYVLRGEAVGEDQELNETVKRIYSRFTAFITEDLREWMKEREIPDVDPELLSYMMLGATEFVIYRISMDNRYTIKDYFITVMKVFMIVQTQSAEAALSNDESDRKKYETIIGLLENIHF